eukprot:COSAG06_NODE_268_length_18811_cov_4.369549_9_plen_45_part_00
MAVAAADEEQHEDTHLRWSGRPNVAPRGLNHSHTGNMYYIYHVI